MNATTNPAAATTPSKKSGLEGIEKKKKREATGKPRAPARPYKRLDAEVLAYRLLDLSKKLTVLKSKAVLMQDRLDGHSSENDMRLAGNM